MPFQDAVIRPSAEIAMSKLAIPEAPLDRNQAWLSLSHQTGS